MSPQPAQVSLLITCRTPTMQTSSTRPSRDSLHGFVLQASSLEREKDTHRSPACAFSVYTPPASITTHLHLLTLHVPTSLGLRKLRPFTLGGPSLSLSPTSPSVNPQTPTAQSHGSCFSLIGLRLTGKSPYSTKTPIRQQVSRGISPGPLETKGNWSESKSLQW